MCQIVELGIDGEIHGHARDNFGHRQHAAVREIDRHRVREMAHAAVLVFKGSAVPVSPAACRPKDNTAAATRTG